VDEKTSYSHYEDIDVLDPPLPAMRRPTLQPASDDLYLDPRHPDQSAAASLRRQPTSRSDRFGYTSCAIYETRLPVSLVAAAAWAVWIGHKQADGQFTPPDTTQRPCQISRHGIGGGGRHGQVG